MSLLQIVLLIVVIVLITAYSIYFKYKIGNKLSINGYDVVTYFRNNEPIKGQKKYRLIYKNKIYYFSNDDNKQIFLKNPTQYLPQYGGFCSYGMSKGYKETIKPEAFTVVYNKLYLNHNLKYRALWLENRDERIQWANENWEKFKNKKENS